MSARLRVVWMAVAALIMSLPLLAQPLRPGSPREERITSEGHIRSIQPDRDGYRVELDQGGRTFWVPERVVHNRAHDFRVGASIRLGGVFRGGFIVVDVVDWLPMVPIPQPDRGRYHNDVLRGTIERIDYRDQTIMVREMRTDRLVRVDMRDISRGFGRTRAFDDLHRGDYIVMSGDWTRFGGFDADRIESVRPRRW